MVENARDIQKSEAILLMLGGVSVNLKCMSPFAKGRAQKVINTVTPQLLTFLVLSQKISFFRHALQLG